MPSISGRVVEHENIKIAEIREIDVIIFIP
jgi:hypothetical protein